MVSTTSRRMIGRVSFPRPFLEASPATRWLRLVLLISTLLGMLCCLPLWLNNRAYPLAPLIPGIPVLPAPFDQWLLAFVLLSLVSALWFYRLGVSFFLLATLFLYLGDQNRGQPWLYLYWVLLLLSLWPGERGVAAMRVAISASYFWAGVQKLNPLFFKAIPGWFVQPMQQWGSPDWLGESLRLAVAGAPFVEIGIAIGVWFGITRRWALAAVIILHLVSLLLLGPLGHNVNLVIWPWNLAMIALMLALFWRADAQVGVAECWRALKPARGLQLVLALFCLLPLLGYRGWWSSYFSFSLYSANTARADIYLSGRYQERLSPGLQRFVEPVPNFDPAFQKPYSFAHLKWAVAELGVPGVPEPGAFAAVFRMFSQSANTEQDCHMIMASRDGRVWLFGPGQNSPKSIGP